MPAYFVVQCSVHDREGFRSYAEAARETVYAHGGSMVVRGTPTEVSGKVAHNIGVLLKFPDRNAAL